MGMMFGTSRTESRNLLFVYIIQVLKNNIDCIKSSSWSSWGDKINADLLLYEYRGKVIFQYFLILTNLYLWGCRASSMIGTTFVRFLAMLMRSLPERCENSTAYTIPSCKPFCKSQFEVHIFYIGIEQRSNNVVSQS